ncbi:MAG TPA: PA2779 family protein [Terriglobales bacterium]
MISVLKKAVRSTAAASLAALFLISTPLVGQDHVVSPADLQKQAVAATQTRERNAETLTNALSTPAVQKAMANAHIDGARVKSAIPSLTDAELASLAARADKANTDFAAGRMSDHDLILILIGVAVLILLIVALH